MENTIRKNEKCFIGLPICGYGFESAKSCFVACPSEDKYNLEIDTIKNILESKQYVCEVALKRIDPGNFAFCTKICSKIIQSQFCMVLLDPSYDKDAREIPNPNVHLEYGMMISQNKYIIPLQRVDYELPFNIAPLDTVKYNDSNFKIKVTEAIENAVSLFSANKPLTQPSQLPNLLIFYSLKEYNFSDTSIQQLDRLYKLGAIFGFSLFDIESEVKYKYVGIFAYEEPKIIILHTKLLINKIISLFESLMARNQSVEEKSRFLYLKDNITIDLIVPPYLDKNDVKDRITENIDRNYSYKIDVYYLKDINDAVENAYKQIGDIRHIDPPKD